MRILFNGRLITHDAANPYIEHGAVAYENGQIVAVGNSDQLMARFPEAETIDAQRRLIMPGLINTHHHIYSAFARGLNLGISPHSFGEILEQLWWRLDKKLTLEDVTYSAYVTLLDCIEKGVTTMFDHHASQTAVQGSLFAISDVAKTLGIRANLCYEVTDRDGEARMQEGIEENVAFISHAQKMQDGMQAGLFGLHASLTLSDATLDRCVAALPQGSGFHVHAAEGIEDLHDSLRRYGKRVVHRLMDHGILQEKTLAVHCVHINNSEIDLLAQTGTAIIQNPESNMSNAVGCPPTLVMIERGARVGLGTDGYTSDMLESMKVANALHKHNTCNPSAAWAEIPQMLFENNAAIASKHFGVTLGVLKEGAAADILLVDYQNPTPLRADNINGHILFGLSGLNVDTTIIAGKTVMEHRKHVGVDSEAIYAKARETAESLWKRV